MTNGVVKSTAPPTTRIPITPITAASGTALVPTLLDLVRKLQSIRDHLNTVVFEREAEIDGILLAVLSKTSCFFYGAPGTAKTHLIRSTSQLLGLSVFDILLSETTKPDAIFGPVDVPALAQGTQRTKIKGYAPDSELLFFDEIFKANATVLNPLLWLINEHEYRNGDDGIIQCPVRATFAASNEIPEDDTLSAVYDRLLLRYEIGYIRNQGNMLKMVEQNLKLGADKPFDNQLTVHELDRLTKAVQKVTVSQEIIYQVFKIRDQIQASCNSRISDRRLARSFRIMQAHALMDARHEVQPKDIEVLSHIFWDRPEHHHKISSIVLAHADSTIADLMGLSLLAQDILDAAIKTGAFASAIAKLESLHSKVDKYQTGKGKKIADDILDKLNRTRSIVESRREFFLIRMRLNSGIQYKVMAVTSLLWSQKEMRSVDMHFFRAGEYWYHHGPSNLNKIARKKFERKMKDKILEVLGAKASIRKL